MSSNGWIEGFAYPHLSLYNVETGANWDSLIRTGSMNSGLFYHQRKIRSAIQIIHPIPGIFFPDQQDSLQFMIQNESGFLNSVFITRSVVI